jgi:hypothetical protein
MCSDFSREGPAISSAYAKAQLGRALFQRPQGKNHQGFRSDGTAYQALNHLSHTMASKPPTRGEMEILFKENPVTVASLRAKGFTDQQIYDQLDNLQ